ncbi:MAG: extracellular solute-binding protein [Lachnospirales bacterium]
MVTIKDVAKRASVSIGTVSNVLNGKTKNIELIDKVEAAVKELKYIPDIKAQNLKKSKTNLIGLVINNNFDDQSVSIITEVSNYFYNRGFDVITITTNGNSALEEKAVQHFVQLGADGLIVNTTTRKKKWIENYKKKLPIVFLNNTPTIYNKINTIKFDYKNVAIDFYEFCKKNNKKQIAMLIDSSQKDFILEFDDNFYIKIIKIIDPTKELGFKLAYELLCENRNIDTILLGNSSLTKGVKKAMDLIGDKGIDLICIKNQNWIEDSESFSAVIDISMNELASVATRCLIDKINFNKTSLSLLTQIETKFINIIAMKKIKYKKSRNEVLKIAVLDTEISTPLENISSIYERETGVRLLFEKKKYKELAEILSYSNMLKSYEVDIIMYDLLWKNSIDGNLLATLNADDNEYFNSFIDFSVLNYGIINGKLKGLPLLGGTQLLIYRKDLFEDASIKRKFELMFNYELQPPRTWEEYNDVAKFFTKKYNKHSMTDFGTSLINEGNIYNSIEMLNRLSLFGNLVSPEEIFEDANVSLVKEEYLNAFEYTDNTNYVKNWEDIAQAFKSGKVAMVILYDSLVYGINDSVYSRIAGNIGCAQIPGGKPVLGGWGIGVSNLSNNIDLSSSFIYWLCSVDTSNLFSILTGTSTHKGFYMNKELDLLYPWKKEVLEGYRNSQIRNTNKKFNSPIEAANYYDKVIGKSLGRLIKGKIGLK